MVQRLLLKRGASATLFCISTFNKSGCVSATYEVETRINTTPAGQKHAVQYTRTQGFASLDEAERYFNSKTSVVDTKDGLDNAHA